MYASGDGGNDEHEGEGDHHPVLEVGHLQGGQHQPGLQGGHLEQERQESNNNKDGLLEEYAKKVIFNFPGKIHKVVPGWSLFTS